MGGILQLILVPVKDWPLLEGTQNTNQGQGGEHLLCTYCVPGGFPGGSVVKNPPAMQEIGVQPLGGEDALEEGMATHCSILVWRIPQTESLAGYSPWGCKESDIT